MKKQTVNTKKAEKKGKSSVVNTEEMVSGASRAFEQIHLTDISVNPLNPRKNFDGPKYDELLASVRTKGVLVPIMVRPLPSGSPTLYEIIAGERRFRVSCDLARNNGGIEKAVIPALIQELSDDDAFDVMTIENLQRADLTPLEEARAFKIYLDKKGMESLPDLAERVGINPCYIHRRTSVLALPDVVLKAWEEGRIYYGHLEQLIRLSDEDDLNECYRKIIEWRWGVRQLKDHIDGRAPKLQKALFDWKKAECISCTRNTDIQRSLFGDEYGIKSCCLDPKCFKQNQVSWIGDHWDKFKKSRKLETNGVAFSEDLNYSEYEYIYRETSPICSDCVNYRSIIDISGRVVHEKVCTGEKGCYRQQYRSENASGGKEKDPNAPRVPWHGEFFREEFYKTRIPELISALPADDEKVLRIVLLSLLETHYGAADAFREKYGKETYHYRVDRDYWPILSNLQSQELQSLLQELSLIVLMDKEKTEPNTRRLVADHLGSNLQEEWKMTKEYLDKKTTKEIHAIAEQFGVWKDKTVRSYLYETMGKKRDSFNQCKKAELVKIILESGIDLTGKVPSEILAVKTS